MLLMLFLLKHFDYREFMDRGSVLLVALLAISSDSKVSHKAENWKEREAHRLTDVINVVSFETL